uniref:hypothetical protein n=1 Tax=Glaesserella sp. TaxID=2094731 RepID=UPI0035A0AB70
MTKTIKISKLLTFLGSAVFLFSPYANSKNINNYLNNNEFFSRDIDIDNNGVMDKVISNINGFGNALLFFRKDNNNYSLVLDNVNLSEDGGAVINDIKKSSDKKYVMIIITNSEKLNIINNYYVNYENNKWLISKITSEFSGFLDDYSKKYICRFDDLRVDLASDNIEEKLPNSNLSDEYINNNCELNYFFESSLDGFIERFHENNINIINGVERYKKLMLIHPYENKTKKQYISIIKKLSELNLKEEKEYIENNIKKEENNIGVIINKSYLYSSIGNKSNMYLVKGDKVKILKKQKDTSSNNWYFINYKGKKDINMWIKAEAVDIKE